MKHPTGEEIWGPGDWWQRRRNEQKINKQYKHLGRHGHYLPNTKQSKHDENIEKTFGAQTISKKLYWIHWFFSLLSLLILNPIGIYILGIILVKLIWGSWFFGIVWPILAPIWILVKFI